MTNNNLRVIKVTGEVIDLVGKQGTTWGPFVINLTMDSLPLDLTDYLARGQIRKTLSSTDSIPGFTVSITNGASGEISVSMTAEDSANIPCGVSWNHTDSAYVWDVEIYKILSIDPLDDPQLEEVSRFFGGKLYIDPEVTR